MQRNLIGLVTRDQFEVLAKDLIKNGIHYLAEESDDSNWYTVYTNKSNSTLARKILFNILDITTYNDNQNRKIGGN